MFRALVVAVTMTAAQWVIGCGGSSSPAKPDAGKDAATDLGGGSGGSGGLIDAGSGGSSGGSGGSGGAPVDAAADAAGGTGGSTDAPADVPNESASETSTDVTTDFTIDTATETPADGAIEAAPCGADGSMCTKAGGGNGICQNNVCGACTETTDDAKCVAAYGAMHLCVAGACVTGTCHTSTDCPAGQLCSATAHTCGTCAGDSACKNDTRYGASTICLTGACVTGDCHDTSADCASGKICGLAIAHSCGSCTTDTNCTADTFYGTGNICVSGGCIKGNCHDSTECSGTVCGATTANTCGACKSDNQCQTDAKYGAAFICDTTVGQTNSGKCVSAACTNPGAACTANSGDFCCGTSCVAGNCCVDNDCVVAFGAGFACSANHTCSQCAAALGNQYLVDPAGGNDATATGSGKVGATAMASCSFKTITRALQVIGSSPPAGTTITIVGKAGATTNLYIAQVAGQGTPESLPIRIPANVKITTSVGPIRAVLPAMAVGFQLTAAGGSIVPDKTALLTIDGATQTSGAGIISSSGAGNMVSIGNVIVQNTGDDAIVVTSGTLNIGPGVVATGAGTTATAATRRDGLHITGGIVSIAVPAGELQTSFNGNSSRGIEVGGVGILNIVGVPVTTPPIAGDGTVVAKLNDAANIYINQTPGAAAAVSTINGVVAWASLNGTGGIHIFGGSKVKVRNSVVLANGQSGIAINAAANTAAGNDLSGIDLGVMNDFGHNILQASIGSNPNFAAGLCVRPGPTAGAQTLTAMGNVFTGPRDCALAAPGTITKAATCTGRVDQGIVPNGTANVTVLVNNCQ